MRWPFGPPHLTLKPSKKKPKKKQKNKKQKTKKQTKKPKKETKSKKKQKYQKKSFSVISQNFLFFGGVSKNCLFLTTWPRKRAPPKHYKNRGFSIPIFEKQLCVTKRPFLDKKTQIHKFQLSFFFVAFFFLFQQQKTQKSAETPIFIVF